jgi:hypothetical protein
MTIKRTGDLLEVRDNPAGFWLFYSFFVLGGGVAVVMGLTALSSGWQSILVVIIGMGNIFGGAYMLRREPASIVRIDLRSKTLSIKRWGVFGRSQISHPINVAKEARLDVTEHTDGGSVFRPVLWLTDGSSIPISCFWYQSDAVSRNVVQEVSDTIVRGTSSAA